MSNFDIELDTSGLSCPLPVLKARKALSSMSSGQRLLLISTDEGSVQDMPAFAKMTGNSLIEMTEQDGSFHFVIIKGET